MSINKMKNNWQCIFMPLGTLAHHAQFVNSNEYRYCWPHCNRLVMIFTSPGQLFLQLCNNRSVLKKQRSPFQGILSPPSITQGAADVTFGTMFVKSLFKGQFWTHALLFIYFLIMSHTILSHPSEPLCDVLHFNPTPLSSPTRFIDWWYTVHLWLIKWCVCGCVTCRLEPDWALSKASLRCWINTWTPYTSIMTVSCCTSLLTSRPYY